MMFEKLAGKGALMRLVTVLLIARWQILALNILTVPRIRAGRLSVGTAAVRNSFAASCPA